MTPASPAQVRAHDEGDADDARYWANLRAEKDAADNEEWHQ